MTQTFEITLSQMTVFFIFMAVGYIFRKKSVLPDDAGSALSKLILYVFLPALCFDTFSSNLNGSNIARQIPIIGWSALILAVTFALSIPLARLFSRDNNTRAIYSYAFTIPNIGYIGYPLVKAVFGEAIQLDFMVFTLCANLFIYTVGMYMLNPKHEFSPKSLINPIFIAIIAGAAVGLSGLKVPSVITTTLNSASACMGPCAMLLTGFVLARSPISEMLCSWRMYVAGAIRLIIIPAAAGVILYLCGVRGEIGLLTCCMLSLPMGLNNVVFPEAFGGDSKTGAQSCFVSNVMGLITIPFAYMVTAAVFG